MRGRRSRAFMPASVPPSTPARAMSSAQVVADQRRAVWIARAAFVGFVVTTLLGSFALLAALSVGVEAIFAVYCYGCATPHVFVGLLWFARSVAAGSLAALALRKSAALFALGS